MKEIELTRGKVALVSDHRHDELVKRSWCYMPSKSGDGYAATTINGKSISMQVWIGIMMWGGIPDGHDVDHVIAGDTLNNQDENLRLATQAQNAWNRRPMRGKFCRFKGVSYRKDKKARPWVATIQANGVRYHLGFFNTPEEAGHAYDVGARQYHGEFAYLNNIEFDDDGPAVA